MVFFCFFFVFLFFCFFEGLIFTKWDAGNVSAASVHERH